METRKVNSFFLLVLCLLVVGSFSYALFFKGTPRYLSTVFIEVVCLLIPSIIYIVVRKLPVKQTLRLNKLNITSVFLIIVLAVLCQPLMSFLGLIPQMFFKSNVEAAIESMKAPYFAMILIIGLTPAICEETVMRGVVLSGYKNVSVKKAALMNGFLFGIFHLNPEQFLYAFALGFIFVYLVYITKSIFASMLCHFMVNSINYTYSTLLTKETLKTTAKQPEIRNLPLDSKLIFFFFWLIVASVSVILIITVIKALIKVNSSEIGLKDKARNVVNIEKVFNWPVAVVILVYMFFVGRLIYIGAI